MCTSTSRMRASPARRSESRSPSRHHTATASLPAAPRDDRTRAQLGPALTRATVATLRQTVLRLFVSRQIAHPPDRDRLRLALVGGPLARGVDGPGHVF